MKTYLEKAIFVNRAPFKKLELNFEENEIAVLSAVNGMGKTTVLSHLADAFYEMVKQYYSDITEDTNKYYRVSSSIFNLDTSKPSFVYFRFKTVEDSIIDYVDLRNNCSEQQYNEAIMLEGKIDFNSQIKTQLNDENNIKKVSPNFTKEIAEKVFKGNVNTYFPSYRFENPGYLNDPHTIRLDFSKKSRFAGRLHKPIEVVSGLSDLANWIMDIVLDLRQLHLESRDLLRMLDLIITQTLISKEYGRVRFGVGLRDAGSTRLQIVEQDSEPPKQVYPSIFNLSSGESALLCLFGGILRQADINKTNISSPEITGIVLVDEVDKHLHIKLQKEVLPGLFLLFPNVQFIVSCHSPFVGMGLADIVKDRAKIIDLESGLSVAPTNDPQYQEVYDMMIKENERFKKMYESIHTQIESSKVLQIVTEGKNSEHVETAIGLLDGSLMEQIKIIKGSEDKSGNQQLKNTFEIMSKGEHLQKFLFVWDCDSKEIVDPLIETSNFFKFLFQKNAFNTKAKKGIENLYPESLFTDDVYDKKEIETDYGGSKKEKSFNKNTFLKKIKKETDPNIFENFKPLIDKIKSVINKIN
jgi:predicted ATP-binding protein involved in virulence